MVSNGAGGEKPAELSTSNLKMGQSDIFSSRNKSINISQSKCWTRKIRSHQRTKQFLVDTVSFGGVDSDDGVTCNLKRFVCFFRKNKSYYFGDYLDAKIYKLHKYCLTHLIDSYRLHLNRLKGKFKMIVLSKYYFFRVSQECIFWTTSSRTPHWKTSRLPMLSV